MVPLENWHLLPDIWRPFQHIPKNRGANREGTCRGKHPLNLKINCCIYIEWDVPPKHEISEKSTVLPDVWRWTAKFFNTKASYKGSIMYNAMGNSFNKPCLPPMWAETMQQLKQLSALPLWDLKVLVLPWHC